MSDTPKCEKCGLEITTGMMAAFCNQADQCEFWPHSDGTPAGDGGELFMARAWMQQACKQIGLQIDDRKRLERENAILQEKLAFLAKFAREACVTDSRDIGDWQDDMNYIAVVAESRETLSEAA